MKNPDKFYMQLAYVIAQESKAKRLQVGAIIVKDDNIISFGYNGTPKGFDNTCEDAELNELGLRLITRPEVLHAESNAITKCAKSTMSCDGATLYTTESPCYECCKLIIQAGIKKVVYHSKYRDTAGLELLNKANIEVYDI